MSNIEPWLRGTHTDLDPTRRAVLHALELAQEDLQRWCAPLDTTQLEASAYNLPSTAIQLRHIARSLDRLMAYAEGKALTEAQLQALKSEHIATEDPLYECLTGIDQAIQRLLTFTPEDFEKPRTVGRAALPTTVASLLIHIAEHTQRHVGQAITTAKLIQALHEAEAS